MAAIETQQVVVEKDVVFGRGGIQTLICTECGTQRQWFTRPVGRMVTAELLT